MGLFSFIGSAVNAVGEFFGATDLTGALVKTAGEFIIGGPSGQQAPTRQQPLQSKVAGGLTGTSRVPRPDTPNAPGTADVAAIHAEWLTRMRKFATLETIAGTGRKS